MSAEPLKVLIVDDSRIFRGVIEEALQGRPDIRVIGSVWSGEKAIELAGASLPDFVTLDIEMPGMGGLEALKALKSLADRQQKAIGVVLISSHSRPGAEITMEGLQLGAFDFIPKPTGPDSTTNAAQLREQLFQKLDAWKSRRGRIVFSSAPAIRPLGAVRRSSRFRAVVIGSSTGGPEALGRVLPVLMRNCPVPVFLVQHLPPGFSNYFAESLAKRSGSRIQEARDGTLAENGTVYIGPGGRHLILNLVNGRVALGFSETPPENGCLPAADVLFRSAASVYSGQVLCVVLTGMGSDGAKGAAVVRRAGGHVIAQDESTSVVWGMPGSTVATGAANEVLPLDEIGPTLLRHLGTGD